MQEPSYKDCILFCIDGCDEMYQVNPKTGHSYMHQAIDGAFKVMNKKLISSPRDMVGIIIFGTVRSLQRPAACSVSILLNSLRSASAGTHEAA